MKKLLFITFVFGAITSTASAQKIGYYFSDSLGSSKSFKKIDSAVVIYAKTLDEGYTYLQNEYNEKAKKLQDSASLNGATKGLLKADLVDLYKKMGDYSTEANKKLADKRKELYDPYIKRLNATLGKLSKEEGCDYIIDASVLKNSFFVPKDDLTSKVLSEMK